MGSLRTSWNLLSSPKNRRFCRGSGLYFTEIPDIFYENSGMTLFVVTFAEVSLWGELDHTLKNKSRTNFRFTDFISASGYINQNSPAMPIRPTVSLPLDENPAVKAIGFSVSNRCANDAPIAVSSWNTPKLTV